MVHLPFGICSPTAAAHWHIAGIQREFAAQAGNGVGGPLILQCRRQRVKVRVPVCEVTKTNPPIPHTHLADAKGLGAVGGKGALHVVNGGHAVVHDLRGVDGG